MTDAAEEHRHRRDVAHEERADLRRWMNTARETSLRASLAGYGVTKVSPEGLRCADMLERLFGGFHHFPGGGKKLRAVRWDDFYVAVLLQHGTEAATYDGCLLTNMVFLGHALCIRTSLSGRGMERMELQLHPRARTEGICYRHPRLDEAVASFNEWNPHLAVGD